MSPYLQISKLILVGYRKNYEIKFNPGVNIVYGDSDTGKSSILEFINYLLGSSGIELADEIISSVDHAVLEIKVNESTYTIKRDIYNKSELIDVYESSFEESSNHIPDRYAPNFNSKIGAKGYFSDFLLDILDLPKISIKVSPSKSDSEIKRLGFRSIFKFCYLDQDKVGGKNFLDLGNWSQATTNREVFKYIFNILDSKISDLEALISNKEKESKGLKERYTHVSEFLRDAQEGDVEEVRDSLEEIEENIINLNSELIIINANMTSSSDTYNEIKSLFDETNLKHKGVTKKLRQADDVIEKYSKLKNDYQNDIDKITAIIVTKSRLRETSIQSFPCPICESSIEEEQAENPFSIEPIDALNQELLSLKSRKKNIEDLLASQLGAKKIHLKEELTLKKDVLDIREALDTENESMITPFLTERDSIISEIATQTQLKESYRKNLKILNQQEKLANNFGRIDVSLISLAEQLEALQIDAPDIHKILNSLGVKFDNYLKAVNIKNKRGVRISEKSFVPIIRGRDYYKITSGGLRTIASIGHLLSILNYSLTNNLNHPRLLMIDTVGKYLGKTTNSKYLQETDSSEDVAEGVSDPIKYQNIYEKIISTVVESDEDGKQCQVILVDNDVPEALIERYKGYIVAHYSSKGENGLKTGLIDDFINEEVNDGEVHYDPLDLESAMDMLEEVKGTLSNKEVDLDLDSEV